MNAFREFQMEIHRLTASEQFSEALLFFKQHKTSFTKEQICDNQYLVSDMLKCLRMTRAWEATEKFLDIYGILINEETPERILTAWMLALYDWYKSLQTSDEDNNENKAVGKPEKSIKSENTDTLVGKLSTSMPLLANMTSEFAVDFYNVIVLRILKYEARKAQVNWRLLKEFCAVINSEKLKTSCQEVTFSRKGKEKTTELASVLEYWYAQYSKSLFSLGEYDRCLELCREAFGKVSKMHYSNEIWFSRRIAQCLNKQGDTASAIREFEMITAKKGDWFMLAELAALHHMAGDLQKALVLMHRAMLQPGDLGYKVELVEKLGDLYATMQNQSLSEEHYSLAIIIRKVEGWGVDSQLLYKAGELVNLGETERERDLLYRKLKDVWSVSAWQAHGEVRKKSTLLRITGKIEKLFSPKEVGVDLLIRSIDGKQYYGFIKRTDAIFNLISIGTKISFEVIPVPERKLDKAIKIRLTDD